MSNPLSDPPELKCAIKYADRTWGWSETELVYIVTTLMYRLADYHNLTIREMGEDIISQMEEGWKSAGGDTSLPPRYAEGLEDA